MHGVDQPSVLKYSDLDTTRNHGLLLQNRCSLEDGESANFIHAGTVLKKAGFTAIMPWAAPTMAALPELAVGEKLPLKDVELRQVCCSKPCALPSSSYLICAVWTPRTDDRCCMSA